MDPFGRPHHSKILTTVQTRSGIINHKSKKPYKRTLNLKVSRVYYSIKNDLSPTGTLIQALKGTLCQGLNLLPRLLSRKELDLRRRKAADERLGPIETLRVSGWGFSI